MLAPKERKIAAAASASTPTAIADKKADVRIKKIDKMMKDSKAQDKRARKTLADYKKKKRASGDGQSVMKDW